MAMDFGLKREDLASESPQVATDLISAVKPRTSPRTIVSPSESDRLASESGFKSREPAPLVPADAYLTPRKKKRRQEVTTPLSMRVPRSVHVRFLEYSEARVLSYPAALEKLLNESEVLQRLERKE